MGLSCRALWSDCLPASHSQVVVPRTLDMVNEGLENKALCYRGCGRAREGTLTDKSWSVANEQLSHCLVLWRGTSMKSNTRIPDLDLGMQFNAGLEFISALILVD